MRTTAYLLGACLACTFALGCRRGEAHEATAVPVAEEQDAGPRLLGASLELGAEERERMGLVFAALEHAELAPEVRTFGRVLSDPAATTQLRAPFAGTLSPGDVVPALGARIETGSVVFHLAPRWTPQERADLSAREAAARSELAARQAELPALRTALERARALNEADKSVSDRELEELEGRLRVTEAHVAGATEVLRAVEAAAGGAERVRLTLPLTGAGEVTELLVHAGEEVEAGTVLLRVEDFREPLVALDVPVGRAESTIRSARVLQADGSGELLPAERLGVAPLAGTAGLSPAILFRLRSDAAGANAMRPGLLVTAWLDLGQPVRRGVLVPGAAVVRLAGQAFVYAQRGGGALERLPIALEQPLAGGWFADEDWTRGESLEVVVRGAQNVLSCELLGRQGEEEE